MIVQIYEINSVKDALKMAELGVDHVGVVVGNGEYENEVHPYKAKEIFLALPEKVKGIALSLSSDINQISRAITDSEPDILHLATPPKDFLPPQIDNIKKMFPEIELMKTIPVTGEESVATAMVFDGVCDYLLLDTKDDESGQIGMTGKVHDWDISAKIVESVDSKVILAGGLSPENVVDAIKKVSPDGVDSKTKTDKLQRKGKDFIKVKRFVDLARSSG